MRRLEWIVGLVGGIAIALALVYLAVYRSQVIGFELLPSPGTATPYPTIPSRLSSLPATVIPSATRTPVATLASSPTPEASAPVVLPTPSPVIHIVKRGDNLYRIALTYGVSLEALASANRIVNTSQVYVGQQLLIPVTPGPAAIVAQSDSPAVAASAPTGSPGVASRPQAINSVPVSSIIVITTRARQTLRDIYSHGQALGNDSHAFSSVGDSTIEYPYFMTRFDQPGRYNLGEYQHLQVVIDYYTGSFDRESQAVMRGLRASTALDPFWSNKAYCYSNESRLACEYRLHRPSIVFIRLGSNETQPEVFDQYLRQVVDFWINNGVIPIMGTKADRHEGPGNADNNLIRQIALDYNLPLWDFDLVAQTIPGGGVGADGIHLTSFFAHDYTLPEALQRGYGVHNLTALMALEGVWRAIVESDVEK